MLLFPKLRRCLTRRVIWRWRRRLLGQGLWRIFKNWLLRFPLFGYDRATNLISTGWIFVSPTRWSGPSCAGLVTYNLVILVTRALLISKVTKVITLVISSVTRNQFSKNLPFRTYTFFGLQKAIFFMQFCCVCESELFFGAPFF